MVGVCIPYKTFAVELRTSPDLTCTSPLEELPVIDLCEDTSIPSSSLYRAYPVSWSQCHACLRSMLLQEQLIPLEDPNDKDV